jgi:hypothetical protein
MKDKINNPIKAKPKPNELRSINFQAASMDLLVLDIDIKNAPNKVDPSINTHCKDISEVNHEPTKHEKNITMIQDHIMILFWLFVGEIIKLDKIIKNVKKDTASK